MNVLNSPLEIESTWLGEVSYRDAVALMEKTIAAGGDKARIWGLSHPLVYTTGLKTEAAHILNPALKPEVARRGGSVTLHNPGQLVVYFAFPLTAVVGGLERFVRVLEAALAEMLLDYKIPCNFSPGASGVFTDRGKIAFIGLGLKKNFIYHGVSLNVANSLADFQSIQSCGLTLPITRMADFLPNVPEMETVFGKFLELLTERCTEIDPAEFRDRVEGRHDLADWQLGFRLGWLYFHERRYWEAHEIWELYWHEMPPGELRIFFHAMIQAAMAWYKIFTAPNAAGAYSLLSKALEKLHIVPEIVFLDNQPAFIAFLERSQKRLATLTETQAPEDFPGKAAEDFVPPLMAWR